MKRLLANQDEMVAKWVAARMPIFEFGSSPYTALGLMSAGGIIAGVVYQNFTKIDIHMHIASVADKRWLNRHFLGEGFRYPFEQLGCKRVTALIPARNQVAEDFDKRLGFSYEGRIRQILSNGDDLLIYGMLREECKWLKVGLNHGRKQHSTRDGWRHETPSVLASGRNP